MNVKRVLYALNGMCPNKKILILPEAKPSEILCEVEPTEDHPHYSVAVAIIDRSASHVHKKTTETYEVIRGVLKLNVNGKETILKEKDKLTVFPNEIHFAKGQETWVKVTSFPGRTQEDDILVDK